jgi:Secretion system C-terminal sorting domain
MRKLYTFLLLLCISVQLSAQPGNNCVTAIPISNSGCSGSVSMTGTELYFTVKATSTSHFFQVLNTDTINGYATKLELFANNCTGVPLFTANGIPTRKAVFGVNAYSLSPGQIYILRVSRSTLNPSIASFEVCRQQWSYSTTGFCGDTCNILCNGDFENFTQGPPLNPINCSGGDNFNSCLLNYCWQKTMPDTFNGTTPDYMRLPYASCVNAPVIPHSCNGLIGVGAIGKNWREYVQQTFSFPSTGTYQISFYARRDAPTPSGGRIGCYIIPGTVDSTNFTNYTVPTQTFYIPANNSWYEKKTFNINITNINTQYTIVLGVYEPGVQINPTQYFLIDDVFITPVQPFVTYYTPTCSDQGLNFAAANPTGNLHWTSTPSLQNFPSNNQVVSVPPPVATGSYTITLTTTSAQGCATTEIPIVVSPPPPAQVTPTGSIVICLPNFPQLSTPNGNYTFQWYLSQTSNITNAQPIPWGVFNTLTAVSSGYYHVVVTDTSTGCLSRSNIVQVTVHPSPVAGILGVVPEKCSAANNGTILSGATGGTQPYSYAWSTTPVQTTAGAVNLNAGTYTVTVTDANGCTSSAQATVGTLPPLAAPVVTSDAANDILCQSQVVTYTVTNYDQSLQYNYTTNLPPVSVNQLTADTWEVDWGSTCQNVRFTVTASNGTVACDASTTIELGACCPCSPNATDAVMGGYPGSRTVFDLYNTYSSTGIITNPSPGVYDYNNPNGTLYINGAFLVPNAITFNIINSDVQFGSGASIVVLGTTNTRLNVTGSHLHAGCNDMWDGMRVTGGGEIHVTGSLIEDAEKAVYSALGAYITVTDAVFNKNYIGVEYDTYSGDHPGVITNTVFTCRQLPVGANVALLKGAQTFTNFIQEYPVANYTGTALLNPRSGQRSYAGVYVRNNGSAVVSPSTADVTSFTAARIGTSTGYSDLNVFDNLDYGVYAYYSNVIVENNAFQYITSPQIINPNTTNTGAGVYGLTFSEPGDVWVMRVGGTAGGQTNTFWNCGRGVDLNGYYVTEVSSNLFHSAQVLSPASLTPGYGAYGIFLKSGNSRRTDVQYNEVVNVRNGIALFADAIPASSGQYYKFIGLGTISNNRIAEQPSFGAPVTGAYVQVGMVIQNVIPSCSNCLTEITTDRLYVENNVFEQVFNGIRLLNWNKYPRVADNQIGLKYLAPSPAQQNPQQGIRVINTLTAVVYRNTIIGDAQCLTKTNVRGIYASRSASGIWRCNYVQNVGQCLVFEGNCGAATVFNNQMLDAQDGLVLLNNGIIGAQGSLPSSTSMGAVCDNYWFGPFSHADTYTDQTFAPDTHSPLYIRNTAAPGYIPQVNATTGLIPFDSYIAPGAMIFTNVLSPEWNCNEPAPIAEQGGMGDKGQQVKLMEQIVQDELELSGFVSAGQWMDKKDTYGKLMADSSLMDTSAVLQNFYADAPEQSYGKVAEVNDLAATSNLNVVQTVGSTLPENTDAEFNHKQVLLLFTKQMEGQTLDSSEVALLEQIARTCPLYGGTAVYQAQALLCLVKDEVILFEEDCFVPVNNNRKPRTPKNPSSTTTKAAVYPNPTTGEVSLEIKLEKEQTGYVQVQSITGQILFTVRLNAGSNLALINLSEYSQGVYIYQIFVNEEWIESGRIIRNN